MAEELGAQPAVVRKALANRIPAQSVVEDYVFPWPEAAQPPFGAMVCSIAPGDASAPDRHNQDEVAFVYSGFGEVIAGGGDPVLVRHGDVVFIPRKVEHTFRNSDPDEDLAFFSVWWPRIEPRD